MPSKHTSKHVARTVIPNGGINAKGQKKVTDHKGVIRFIDMKVPRVLNEQGIPVRAPKNTGDQ